MLTKVEEFLKKYKIQNKTVIVGFSAGPDSTALALTLSELKELYNLKIVLAYFNHNWRVEEAKQEERFTINFAKKINAQYYIKKAPKNIKKSEEVARDLRYQFFLSCADCYNSNVVMLAHNKNDNIETLLYRIIKGTSVKGLCCIPENRDIYFRPFLDVEKKDILNYLKDKNQDYLVDSSNFDIKYKRNLIRNEILPLFEKINPSFVNSMDLLIKNSIASKKIINDVLDCTKKGLFLENKIKRNEYLNLNKEIRYEILNDYLGSFLKNRDFKTISRIDDFILANTKSMISVNSNTFLKIQADTFFLYQKKEKSSESILISGVGEFYFSNLVFRVEKCQKKDNKFPQSFENSCYLSILDDDFPLMLRYRKNGDVFSPLGLKNGKMKLKDYFINEKIPQEKRDEYPLLCKNNEILWILGEKISENYKMKNLECYKLSYYAGDKK